MLTGTPTHAYNGHIAHVSSERPPLHLVTPRTAEARILTETVVDSHTEAIAASVRREVFEREWNIRVPPLPENTAGEVMTLIAHVEGHPWPAAVLTVMETTGNHHLHDRFGLAIPADSRVARYTQLAVLRPYRGMNIPLQLVAEARFRFVVPEGFDYTWLLYNAQHARSSSFCSQLNFAASASVFDTEYGPSRVLTRSERAGRLSSVCALERLASDEWIAQ